MKFVPQEIPVNDPQYVCSHCQKCSVHCTCKEEEEDDWGMRRFWEEDNCAQCSYPRMTTPDHPTLQYYKIMPEAYDPIWGTEHAACFDLKACLPVGTKVTYYTPTNEKSHAIVVQNSDLALGAAVGCVQIGPRERMMIPTGLMFDIPTGYSLRIHSRSGLAVKQGLVLANHEGVVDSDYVDPTYVVLTNDSDVDCTIFHGDRIGQGEMQIDIAYQMAERNTPPLPKSDRKGGFGSTGKN